MTQHGHAGQQTTGTADASSPSSTRTVDVLVVGGGSAAETAGPRAAAAGLSVVVVETSLLGGECPFRACVPSKSLLLAAHGHRASGGQDHASAWAAAVERRRQATGDLDDSGKVSALRDAGVEVVRGWADGLSRDAGGGGLARVRRDDGSEEVLRWRRVVVATGSVPARPPVDGLDDVPVWTSDDALTSDHLPRSLVVLGGGAVGCELSQVYASFGVTTTLVETAPRLLTAEQPGVGEAVEEALTTSGVDVRTGRTARRARPGGAGVVLTLDDSSQVEAERILLVTGRRPRTECLDALGLDLTDAGAVATDDRYRASIDGEVLDDVFAVGDVNGRQPYTHGANYQARVVADVLVGRPRVADETGVPRAVYTDPPVFCTGLSAAAAQAAGHEVVVTRHPSRETGRAHVERFDGPGSVELVVDVASGVLVGAAVVGPEADSWGGELALAVRARLDVELLADVVHPFPAWSELILPAAEEARDAVRDRLAPGR